MMYPTAHRSGWDKLIIKAEYEAACGALSQAIVAFMQINVSDRDYHTPHYVPSGISANAVAHAEHISRLDRLVTVRAELEEIISALEDLR
jgi:hypothetical protein